MPKLSTDVRAELRYFAFYLGNGTLDLDILGDIDYSDIFSEPSSLESIFVIFANVLEFDDSGKVTNAGHAMRRAAQYIRTWYDQDYAVEPPFAPWETELH